jgi:tetratricopeptide (TPR) repeat protein
MRQIRAALGDEAGEPHYIETVARHGYRFVAEIRQDDAPPAAVAVADRTHAHTRARGLHHGLAVGALLTLAVLVTSSGHEYRPDPAMAGPAGNAHPKARDLYENARQLANYEQEDRQILAASLLRRALLLDPEYGPAHALLADLVTQHGTAYLKITGERDDAFVARHLALAERYGADRSDLLVIRGRQLLYGERRPGPAFAAFQRAIEENPRNPLAWQLSAEVLYLQGRFDDALEASRRAEQFAADPNGVLWDRLQIYYFSERFDELFGLHAQLGQVQKTGAITVGVALELDGRHAEAFDYIVDALRHRGILIGDSAEATRWLRAGDKPAAYRWLLAEIARNEDPPIRGRAIAVLQALSGDEAGAARTLRAYVGEFERMEAGTHVDCLCFMTIPIDPFFRHLADRPLVREALAAVDATVSG